MQRVSCDRRIRPRLTSIGLTKIKYQRTNSVSATSSELDAIKIAVWSPRFLNFEFFPTEVKFSTCFSFYRFQKSRLKELILPPTRRQPVTAHFFFYMFFSLANSIRWGPQQASRACFTCETTSNRLFFCPRRRRRQVVFRAAVATDSVVDGCCALLSGVCCCACQQ